MHLIQLNHTLYMVKPNTSVNNCTVLKNISFLQKDYISWKLFLAKAHRQQEEQIPHDNKINQLKTEILRCRRRAGLVP